MEETLCNGCRSCINVCKEKAVGLSNAPFPLIDARTCIGCGACIRSCPTESILSGKKGYRILLGGRLGRHPRLARELNSVFTEDQVLRGVKACLAYYKKNSRGGQRFSDLMGNEEIPRDILQAVKSR